MEKRRSIVDSAEVKSGSFQLKGSLPQNAILAVGTSDHAALFFNDGTPLKVSLPDLTLKGSALNEKLNGYDREMTPIDDEINSIMTKARAGQFSQAQMDSVVNVYQSLSERKEARQIAIVRENLDNMIPVIYLGDLVHSLSYEQLKEFCNESRPYYNHQSMLTLIMQRDNLAKRQPGMMFTFR